MTPLRPAKRLRFRGDSVVVLETNPSRRVLYAFLFVVLLIALVMNLDPSRDFTGNRLVGTTVFLLIMLALLAVSLSSWRMVCNREAGEIVVQRVLVVIVLSQRRIETARVGSLVLRRAVLMKGSGPSGRVADSLGAGGSLAGLGRRIRQRELVSLELKLDDETMSLDSATDPASLRTTGSRLAEFLEVSFREIET